MSENEEEAGSGSSERAVQRAAGLGKSNSGSSPGFEFVDYFDLLESSPGDPDDTIESRAREKIKDHHPDVSDHEDASYRLKQLIEARRTLTTEPFATVYRELGHFEYLQRLSQDGEDGIFEAMEELRSEGLSEEADSSDPSMPSDVSGAPHVSYSQSKFSDESADASIDEQADSDGAVSEATSDTHTQSQSDPTATEAVSGASESIASQRYERQQSSAEETERTISVDEIYSRVSENILQTSFEVLETLCKRAWGVRILATFFLTTGVLVVGGLLSAFGIATPLVSFREALASITFLVTLSVLLLTTTVTYVSVSVRVEKGQFNSIEQNRSQSWLNPVNNAGHWTRGIRYSALSMLLVVSGAIIGLVHPIVYLHSFLFTEAPSPWFGTGWLQAPALVPALDVLVLIAMVVLGIYGCSATLISVSTRAWYNYFVEGRGLPPLIWDILGLFALLSVIFGLSFELSTVVPVQMPLPDFIADVFALPSGQPTFASFAVLGVILSTALPFLYEGSYRLSTAPDAETPTEN